MLAMVIAICVGLYIMGKIFLWLERKVYCFIEIISETGEVIGSTLLELKNIVNSSIAISNGDLYMTEPYWTQEENWLKDITYRSNAKSFCR